MKILITKERKCSKGQTVSTFDTIFTPRVLKKLEEIGEVRCTYEPLEGEELKNALKDIDIVIARGKPYLTNLVKWDETLPRSLFSPF